MSLRDMYSLSPTRNTWRNATAEHAEKSLFDLEIACKTDLSKCFQIFTDSGNQAPTPVRRQHTLGFRIPEQPITIFTDGACFHNGKANTKCSSRIWVAPESQLNTALKVPGPD